MGWMVCSAVEVGVARWMLALAVLLAGCLGCSKTSSDPTPVRLSVIVSGSGSGCVKYPDHVITLSIAEDGSALRGAEFDTGPGVLAQADRGICNLLGRQDSAPLERFDPFDPGARRATARVGMVYPTAPLAVGSTCWIGGATGVSVVDFSIDPPLVSHLTPPARMVKLLVYDGKDAVVAIPERLPESAWIFTIDERGHVNRSVETVLSVDSPEQPTHALIDGDRLVILSDVGDRHSAGSRLTAFSQRLSSWQRTSSGLRFQSALMHKNPANYPEYRPWRSLALLGGHLFFCAGGKQLLALPLSFDAASVPVLAGPNTGRCMGVVAAGNRLYVLGSEGYESSEKFFLFRGNVSGDQFRITHSYEVPPNAGDVY